MTPALINHLWQSTLFSVLAALLAFALRKNRAQARYCLWLIASLKFLVPFSLIVALGSYLAPSKAMPAAQAGFSLAMREVSQPFSAPAVSIANVHPTVNAIPIALFAVWFCGFVIMLIRWCAQWLRVRSAIRAATPLPIDAGVQVLCSPALLEPGIFGIFRPVLLLPEGIADHLTREQFEAIVAHELCHVRRRDNLFAALHMLVEAIFWFHPLVWWIGARLVEERERACDEEVLRQGNQPHIYAESILKTCQFYLESPLVCMSGVTGSDLKKRVVRIMTQRAAHPIDSARKALLAAAGALAIGGPLAFGLMNAPEGRAQTPDVQATGTKPKFAVASIRPDKTGGDHNSIRISPGGKLFVTNVTLGGLIQKAFGIGNSQMAGGPSWINSERFDIQAEASVAPPMDPHKMTEAQLEAFQEQEQLRLRSLLEDRFQLKVHRETAERPIYTLIIAKGGPKFHETPAAALDPQTGGPLKHRRLHFSSDGQLSAIGVPLRLLADQLSNQLGRPVLDETGLKGFYDFTLHWTPDRNEDVMFHGRTFEGPQETGPSIFTALQDQLGLKLKSEKGPVEVLVIDHVEQPSAN